MIDPFMILAPVLLFAVIALLRFVGCKTFGSADSGSASPPTITSVSPSAVTAGGPLFTLIVNGTGFVNEDVQSVVQWNGVDRVTSFFDSTKVPAFILAADIASPGTANVTVNNKNTLDGTFQASTPAMVTVNSPAPPPPPPPVTVTFGNDALGGPPPGPPGSPLNGVYKNLDFGMGAWNWVDPALGMGPANAININSGPNPGAGNISFVGPKRVLLRIRVFPKNLGPDGITCNVSITDDNIPAQKKTATYHAADLNNVQFIDTNWNSPAQTFTISADIGFNHDIDTIVHRA